MAGAQWLIRPQLTESEKQVTQLAAAGTGSITGVVLDDRGRPLADAVISAMGNSTSFAVSDQAGQYTLRALMPGPYLLRADRDGYVPARNAMVSVRPATRTVSTFTLRRAGNAREPAIAAASLGGAEIDAAPGSGRPERDQSETAWRLRHLKRSILKDEGTLTGLDGEINGDWFVAESLQRLGRAVESSARVASAWLAHAPLQGQVNLITIGAFDRPGDLLSHERTRGVAFFSLGAPVGTHGDWSVKTAVNQGDLSSWIVTGDYTTRSLARHRYRLGMSYGVHRYEGGNPAAIAAITETARNAGAVYGYDHWTLSPAVSVDYGLHYAHYDYLAQSAHFSPRLAATVSPVAGLRVRASAARAVVAPGGEEFLPPSRTQVLPPQRTFSPLTRDGFRPEDVRHYEVAVERDLRGVVIGVRGFQQAVDDQHVTLFGLRGADVLPAEIGHYFVANAGDVDLRGWGVSVTHALVSHVRGTFDYSLTNAEWSVGSSADRRALSRRVPSALRADRERIHDFTSSLETELPQSATRLFFVYKVNSAFIRADGSAPRPGLDGRWDLQVHQGLPFMNFLRAEWEMLVAVRNLFRDSLGETSVYDEILVARPPKRLVGGITVKF